MKKIITLLLCLLSYPAYSQITPPGQSGSVIYNNGNKQFGGLTFGTIFGIDASVQQLFQASNLLYQITQGMEIDPRYYGASCNTKFLVNNGYFGGGNYALHTTSGSPVISIDFYDFVPGIATGSGGGDVGKQISLTCNNDLGPTTYIASVDASGGPGHTTATLGENMAFTCNPSGINTVVVMGGHASDNATPSLAVDDTQYIENAAADSAIYHGGEVLLPPRCMVHNLTLNQNTHLVGKNGGNNYGTLIGNTNQGGILTNSTTPLFAGFTGFLDDVDRYTGAPSYEAISTDGSTNIRLSDFTLMCPNFPYLGFSGIGGAAIGNVAATSINPEHVLLDHITTFMCPIGWGAPFTLNQPVVFTGSIAANVLTVTAITSTNMHQYSPQFSDVLAVGRAVTGAGITAGTIIMTSPPGGGTGTYTVNISQTVGSETLTSNPPTNFATSGSSRFSQFASDGIGINGAFSDMTSIGDITTGNFSVGWWLGPSTGGAGCGANRIELGRDEETYHGVVMLGCNLNQVIGRQEQFNQGYGWMLLSSNNNTWDGGLMEGNGVSNSSTSQAQVSVGGTSTDNVISNVDWSDSNFSFGGSSQYLLETLTDFSGDYFTIEGGSPRNGFANSPVVVNGGALAHYKQDATGLPFIDTTGSSPITLPASGSIVLANGTRSPAGLAPVNGDTIVGSGGVWTVASASSGGTVTSLTDSSGLFSIANSTTTPTFTYAAQAANTALSNSTGSSAAPTFGTSLNLTGTITGGVLNAINGAAVGGSVNATGALYTGGTTAFTDRFYITSGNKSTYFSTNPTGSGFGEFSTYDYGASAGMPLNINANGGAVEVSTFDASDNSSNAMDINGGLAVGSPATHSAIPTGVSVAAAQAFEGSGFISASTKFTTSGGGCTVTGTTGGATAGLFTTSTTGTCTTTITMGASATAPNGWACTVEDLTSVPALFTGLMRETSSTATTAVFAGTTAASDNIIFNCIGY